MDGGEACTRAPALLLRHFIEDGDCSVAEHVQEVPALLLRPYYVGPFLKMGLALWTVAKPVRVVTALLLSS